MMGRRLRTEEPTLLARSTATSSTLARFSAARPSLTNARIGFNAARMLFSCRHADMQAQAGHGSTHARGRKSRLKPITASITYHISCQQGSGPQGLHRTTLQPSSLTISAPSVIEAPGRHSFSLCLARLSLPVKVTVVLSEALLLLPAGRQETAANVVEAAQRAVRCGAHPAGAGAAHAARWLRASRGIALR